MRAETWVRAWSLGQPRLPLRLRVVHHCEGGLLPTGPLRVAEGIPGRSPVCSPVLTLLLASGRLQKARLMGVETQLTSKQERRAKHVLGELWGPCFPWGVASAPEL